MSFSTEQLQDAFAVAVANVQKTIPDVMTKANYFWYKMTENKKRLTGGTNVQFPINHKELQSQGFINGTTDLISTNPQQTFTYGTLNWKYFYDTVAITLDDLTKTEESKEAIIGLMMAKVNSAKNSVTRKLSLAAHTSGTSSNKQFNGLPDIFAASGTAYAGLTDTDFDTADGWLPELDSSTQVVNYTNIAKMIGKLRARCQGIYNQQTGAKYNVDVAISNYAVREKFAASEQNKARYVGQEQLAAGFDAVKINGVDWVIDEYATGTADGSTADNYLYILSSASLMLFYKYGFENPAPITQEKAIIPNQPIMFNVNYLVGNLACENRRVNGLFKTLIA